MKLSASGSAVAAVTSVLFSSSLVAGQTFTDCNPLKKTCPPDTALGESASFDFTQGESGEFVATGGKPTYDGNGVSLTVAKSGDAPTLTSKFYIMFGHVEFVIKAAPGTGIVSSAVLQSDDLDEIDWEWLGGDSAQVQSNYFSKGKTTSYDREEYHANPDNSGTFYTYTIDWNADRIIWSIDGNEVRTLTPADANNEYPQTPMQVKVGDWAGGDPKNPPGTIEWAGGKTDFSQAPFVMQVKSIDVTDYSSGSQYVYTDHSGSWQSIKAVDGEVNSNGSGGGNTGNGGNDSGNDSGNNSGNDSGNGSGDDSGNDSGNDNGNDGENGSGPDTDSPTVTEGPSVTTDSNESTGMATATEYPWVPNPTDAQDPSSPVTSYAGLPSDWTVSDTGRVLPPNSASQTSLTTSPSSPSQSDSSSADGPEEGTPTDGSNASGGGSSSAAPPTQTGAASSSFGAPSRLFMHVVNAICAGFGALALF